MDPAAARPEDCVPAAVFLAQQDSSGVTAQWFEVRDYNASLVARGSITSAGDA
jgi:hypothetical protein